MKNFKNHSIYRRVYLLNTLWKKNWLETYELNLAVVCRRCHEDFGREKYSIMVKMYSLINTLQIVTNYHFN